MATAQRTNSVQALDLSPERYPHMTSVMMNQVGAPAKTLTPLAKLTRPRLFGAVPRERLFGLLDELRRHPMVWVSGPPGSGKTTLVASYLESRRLDALWYRMDAGDGDPATFFHYLGQASAHADDVERTPLPKLTPERAGDLSGFSRRFLRDLYSRLPRPAVVVLDDYQEVFGAVGLHAMLVDCAQEIPEGVNVVIVSGGEPPSVYSRIIANKTASRLDYAELRLTLEETRSIACATHPMDEAVVSALHRQSDGWATGLTLMLERIRRIGVTARHVEAESREAVFNYFAGEILDKAPLDHQHVLLTSAFLPRITASAAAAISGCADARKVLADLHQRQLFVCRNAGSPPSYQYHPLLRQFLLSRAEELYSPSELQQYRLAPAAADLEEWPIKIFTLGGFKILKNGTEIRFARKVQKRSLELLQALIALGSTDVAVTTLTEALWPDSEGDAAYHAFENTLYRLRQLLGAAGALVLSGGKLTLDSNHCWVDVWALERHLGQMRENSPQSRHVLETALSLYCGHFLEQEGQPSWSLALRERLREKFARLVRDVAQSFQRAKAWAEAAAIYQRGIELDSLNEDLYCGLMVCHRERGNHAEALRVFRRCRELLSIVLSVQPGAQTQAVYQSLKSLDRQLECPSGERSHVQAI
jgi:ATP/maltotriose-dependent transcriptional regulator MalT